MRPRPLLLFGILIALTGIVAYVFAVLLASLLLLNGKAPLVKDLLLLGPGIIVWVGCVLAILDLFVLPVFAFAGRVFPEFHAGLFAFGPLNLQAWQERAQLTVNYAQVGVLGDGTGLSVFGQTSEQSPAKMLHSAEKEFAVSGEIADLSGLSIRRYAP